MKYTIGDRIKRTRLEKNISQKKLAELLNIPVSTLANYENNHREPSIEVITKIINLLELDFEDLLSPNDDLSIEPKKKSPNDKINDLILKIESKTAIDKWIKETDLEVIFERIVRENNYFIDFHENINSISKKYLSQFDLLSDDNTMSKEYPLIENAKTLSIKTKLKESSIENLVNKLIFTSDIEKKCIELYKLKNLNKTKK